MFRRRPKHLQRCPLCGSEAVSAWDSEEAGDGFGAHVRLCCAECGTSREVVATTWAVAAYERRHERQRWQMELSLRQAERLRMATDVAVLAEALRHDLIGPDDFGATVTRAGG